MICYVVLLLYILIIITILVIDNIKNKDIFSPISFIIIMELLKDIPFSFLIIEDRTIIREQAYANFYYNFEDVYIKTFVLKSIYIIIFYFIYNIIKVKSNQEISAKPYKNRTIKYTVVLGAVVGLLAYINFVGSNGGIVVLLNNMSQRSKLFSGSNYIFILFNFWLFSIYLLLDNYQKKANKVLFIFMMAIYVLSMFVFGGRSQILQPIVMAIILYNFRVKKIKIYNIKVILGVALMICFIFLFAIIRKPGQFENYVQNPRLIKEDLIDEGKNLSVELSSIDRQMFVVNSFSGSEYWLFKSIIRLPLGIVPSSIYTNKPPVDDGIYIWNKAIYGEVKVGTPYVYLAKNSWPMTTFSSGYANLGIIGVVFFSIIHAFVITKLYNLVNSNKNIINIFIYINVLFTLQIASLQIMQVIISLIAIFLLKIAINLFNNLCK